MHVMQELVKGRSTLVAKCILLSCSIMRGVPPLHRCGVSECLNCRDIWGSVWKGTRPGWTVLCAADLDIGKD